MRLHRSLQRRPGEPLKSVPTKFYVLPRHKSILCRSVSAVALELAFERSSQHYILNVALVSAVLTSMAFVCWAIPTDAADGRLELDFTLLLTAIAFKARRRRQATLPPPRRRHIYALLPPCLSHHAAATTPPPPRRHADTVTLCITDASAHPCVCGGGRVRAVDAGQ